MASKPLTISATLNDTWQAGAKLSKPVQIAAYLRDVWKSLGHEEELSTDEIIAAYDKVTGDESGQATTEEYEEDVISALEAYAGGEVSGEDEESTISSVSAANRRAIAYTFGQRLSDTGFDDHLATVLAANLETKRGPMVVLDDMIGRGAFTTATSHVFTNSISDNQEVAYAYSMNDLLNMPRPGSKPKKGEQVSDADLMKYDIYKTSIGGDTVRSSWFKDMVLATMTATELANRVEALAEGAKTDPNLRTDRKTDEGQLNAAVNVLRSAVLAALAIHSLGRFQKLRVEIQREADGSPTKTQYPLLVWQEGKRGTSITLTIGQLKHLTDPSEGNPEMTRLDLALAAGGTIEDFKKHGLPKKKKAKGATIKVTDVDTFLTAMFASSTYIAQAGSKPIMSKLLGPKNDVSETYLATLDSVMSALLPIYNDPDVQRAIASLDEKKAKRTKAA